MLVTCNTKEHIPYRELTFVYVGVRVLRYIIYLFNIIIYSFKYTEEKQSSYSLLMVKLFLFYLYLYLYWEFSFHTFSYLHLFMKTISMWQTFEYIQLLCSEYHKEYFWTYVCSIIIRVTVTCKHVWTWAEASWQLWPAVSPVTYSKDHFSL